MVGMNCMWEITLSSTIFYCYLRWNSRRSFMWKINFKLIMVIKIGYNAHVLNHQHNSMDCFFQIHGMSTWCGKKIPPCQWKYFIPVVRLFCIHGMNIPKNIYKFMNISSPLMLISSFGSNARNNMLAHKFWV
jgi:hypothetical protein